MRDDQRVLTADALTAARVERNVWVPMRDGVRLMADIYRPDASGTQRRSALASTSR